MLVQDKDVFIITCEQTLYVASMLNDHGSKSWVNANDVYVWVPFGVLENISPKIIATKLVFKN